MAQALMRYNDISGERRASRMSVSSTGPQRTLASPE